MSTKNFNPLLIDGLSLELAATGDANEPFKPIIHAGALTISSGAFRHIVSTILSEDIDIPVGKLAFADCGFRPGEAWIKMNLKSFIAQPVDVRAALAPSAEGDLQVDIVDIRAGMLPLGRFVEPMLNQVEQQPGLTRTGSMQVTLNLNQFLAARNIPIGLAGKIKSVDSQADVLVLTLG